MLAEQYPKTRINSIYYQRTVRVFRFFYSSVCAFLKKKIIPHCPQHRNIIVELPKEVEDTNQYLGAHFYGRFLTNDPGSDRKVLIYEYKYASFGDPGEKSTSLFSP